LINLWRLWTKALPEGGSKAYQTLFEPTFIFTIKNLVAQTLLERSLLLNPVQRREAAHLVFYERIKHGFVCFLLLFIAQRIIKLD
jgi:hypothetical protein